MITLIKSMRAEGEWLNQIVGEVLFRIVAEDAAQELAPDIGQHRFTKLYFEAVCRVVAPRFQ